MDNPQAIQKGVVRRTTLTALAIIALIGITLIVASVGIKDEHDFWKILFRELGVVLFTVCSVSMIYELFIAETHFIKFFTSLRRLIEQGETNAAVCEQLGIHQIFPTRERYRQQLPLISLASSVDAGSTFRVIGTTLLYLLSQRDAIRQAIERGAHVELCCLDPDYNSIAMRNILEVERLHIASTITAFRRDFVHWLEEGHPPGTVEFRFHQVDLFDSYFTLTKNGQPFAVWDLNFGHTDADKRILVIDPTKGLGANLENRYRLIWEHATSKFSYNNRNAIRDELPHFD